MDMSLTSQEVKVLFIIYIYITTVPGAVLRRTMASISDCAVNVCAVLKYFMLKFCFNNLFSIYSQHNLDYKATLLSFH